MGSEQIRARYVVNCAGGSSDKVAGMIGDDSFTIKPRLGEYVLLKKSSGDRCVSWNQSGGASRALPRAISRNLSPTRVPTSAILLVRL